MWIWKHNSKFFYSVKIFLIVMNIEVLLNTEYIYASTEN